MEETNVLVVEDEAITAMDIQMRLQKLGYKVPAVIDSGEEAISMAEKLRPDLILMDIVLKGKIDGTVAAQRISSTHHIPIVFLTAYSDDDTFNRAKLSDPYGYLTKPFEERDLRIAVELALFKHKLRAQALLTEKLATIGTLAAEIIHEINNPMTYISANLHYLDTQIKAAIPKDIEQQDFMLKLNEVVNESIQGVDRVTEIVHDLKGFARIDQDKSTSVNINEIINTAIKMAHPKFKNRAVLEKDLASDIPLLLLSGSRLHQVILNLIINATQAMEGDNIDKNIIRIKTSAEQNRICIVITDTGKGIAPEVLPKIFDSFFTTKPVGIGTGLGLSICYEIIHNFGGEINVTSHLGKGSSFSIYLPMNLMAENKK